MRALLYCRVSDDRAHGRSVREQETELRALCDREGWTVAHAITESVGASTYSRGERAGWAEVQRLIAAGQADLLVTWENSRAARNLAGYSELRDLCAKHGVRWVYSGRTHDLDDPDDRFTTGLDALLSEKEAGLISARVRRAARADAAAGIPHGGRVLYGYRRVYNERTGKLETLEPEPGRAAIVRRIYEASEGGQGMDSIARDLNADGIPNPSGLEWSGLSVKRVLTNPGYAGRRHHKGEVVGAAVWPPLIDSDRFDRLQLAIHRRRVVRSPNRAWLLTGVTRCGVCKGKVGVKRSGTQPKYVCLGRFCVARATEPTHHYVTRALLTRLASIDSLGLPATDAETEALHAQIAEREALWDDLADRASRGELSVKMLVRQEQTINADLARLRDQLRRRTIHEHLELPVGDSAQWWDAMSDEQRRRYVAAFIEVVVVHKTKRGQRTFDPSKVEIVWR